MEGLLDIVPCPDLAQVNVSSNRTGQHTGWELVPLHLDWNVTFPCWDAHTFPKRDTFKRILDELNIYFTPIIITVGVTGNLMSFLVFTVTHVRRQSSSVFLASLALVDLGFLLSLFMIWFSWIQIPLFHTQGVCQLVVYITYVCTFLSVWYVVGFTVERYIIVWYPLRKDRFCTRKWARIVVLSLAAISCLTYSFATWTSGIVYIETIPLCMPFPQYYNFLTAMTGVDFALTLIIPSVVIVVLNIRIIIKIKKVQKQRQPMMPIVQRIHKVVVDKVLDMPLDPIKVSMHESLSNSRIVHVKFHNHSHSSDGRQEGRTDGQIKTPSVSLDRDKRSSHESDIFRKCHARVHVRSHTQYKTARMLIIVSSVFVILNLPGHVFRIRAFIQTSINEEFSNTRKFDMRWQEIFQLVYHLNFAINFFIYSVCGRQFRTGLKILYARFHHGLRKWRQYLLVRNPTLDQV